MQSSTLRHLAVAIGISVLVLLVIVAVAYYAYRADGILGHGPLPSSTSAAGAYTITLLVALLGILVSGLTYFVITQTGTLTGRFSWLPYVLVGGVLLLLLLVPLGRFGTEPWGGLPAFLVSVPTQLVAAAGLGVLVFHGLGVSLLPASWRARAVGATATAAAGNPVIQGLPGRFTPSAWRVLAYMQEEAKRFEHGFMGTEYLLLGMARERQSLAAKALVNLGVDLETVRTQMEAMVGRRGSLYTGGGGLTRRCQRVIEYSARLARGSGRRTVGTGHLLHSLMTDPEDAAGQLLEGMGVNANRVEEELQRLGYDLEEALASPTGR